MKTKPPNPLRRCRTRATGGGWGGHSGRRKRSGLRFAQRPSLAPGEGGSLRTPQESIRRRFLRMRRQPLRIVPPLGPLQLGSRLLRAAGGKIGGACGRGGTEDIPTLHGGHNRALRFQTPDSEIPMRSCTRHREGKWGEEGARASCSRRIRPRTSRRGTPQVSRSPLLPTPEP